MFQKVKETHEDDSLNTTVYSRLQYFAYEET